MIHLYFKIVLLLLIPFHNGFSTSITTQNKTLVQDSTISYIKKYNDTSLPLDKRLSLVDSVYKYSTQTKNDSLKNVALKEYIKLNFKQKNWDLFHKYRREHLLLTKNIKDSLGYAKTLEYGGTYFFNHHKVDSAYYYYYRSFRTYDNLNDSLRAGRILINLATLQKRNHDYTGSEITSFNAITYLKSSNNLRRISSPYNNLGLIYEQLGDLTNAIKYHKIALDLRTQIKNNPIYQIHSLNNLGLVYTKSHNYDEAISYFEKGLEFENILQNNLVVKAYLIDNYTYTRFKKGDTKDILNSFLEALSIREKEDHLAGIIINCIHLAEYYNKIGDTKKALTYAKRAENESKLIKNYEDYLKAIELLSSLYETKDAKNAHFKKYIAIRDSLDIVGRKHKEQFARIRFETDEKQSIIKKQEKQIKEKQNIIFTVLGMIILITICIIAFYSYKRGIRKKLKKGFKQGFEQYLIKKYSLTPENIEFWTVLAEGLDQNQISEKLHISIDAIKSRRRSLKKKIHIIEKIDGNFDKTKAVILYNKELDLYKDSFLKKEK